MAHRQLILRPEIRRVGLVGGQSNSVRDRSAIAPSTSRGITVRPYGLLLNKIDQLSAP
jgi:hypothetical protein